MDVFDATEGLLTRMGFTTLRSSAMGREVLIFEDDSVIGFVFLYANSQALIAGWESDSEAAVSAHQLALRRAGQKAWNTYVILLATGEASSSEIAALGAIEEDLTGTRKIARSGIRDIPDVEAALLPLLPIQSAPKLDAVDMVFEIRQRATELPPRAVEAFVSGTDGSVVLQVIEETQ
jgi:hypothetical protein